MKNLHISIIAFIFVIIPFTCFANGTDSLKSKPKKIIYKYVEEDDKDEADTSKFGMDIFLTGGIGMTYGNSFGYWVSTFKNGPVVSLGFEIPFYSFPRVCF